MKRGRPRNNQGRNSNQNRKPNPNRALESNGPGIKIRGAASTIFDKYTQLAHDATTSGDRVSAEYYYQYAEHYGRLVQTQVREREKREEEQKLQREARQAEYDARKAARQAERNAEASEAALKDEPKAVTSEQNQGDIAKPVRTIKPRRTRKTVASGEVAAQESSLPTGMQMMADPKPAVESTPKPAAKPDVPKCDAEEVVIEATPTVRRRVRRPRAKVDVPVEAPDT